MNAMRMKQCLEFMKNPYLILAALIGGVVFGASQPEYALALKPVGDAYIELLKMVVLPFLLSAIIGSVIRIVRSEAARSYLTRLSMTYFVGMISAACLGLVLATAIQPGDIKADESRAALGEVIGAAKSALVADLEVSLTETSPAEVDRLSVADAFSKFIPSNVFHALSAGDTLKVLVFAIFFGFAIGFSTSGRSDVLSGLDSVYTACLTLMRWLTYPLPIATFIILASQVAISGLGSLIAMQDFVLTQLLAATILFAISTLLIGFKLKRSPFAVIKGLREPLVLAVTTRSSITCIPSAIESLTKNLRAPAMGTELVLPLGITIFRFGPAFYFAICTVFIAQLYGRELAVVDYVFIAIASSLAAIASTGTTSIVTISLLSLVCIPLRLPFEAAMVLFIATDAITDPFRTLSIVYGNCAASVWITGRTDEAPGVTQSSVEPATT